MAESRQHIRRRRLSVQRPPATPLGTSSKSVCPSSEVRKFATAIRETPKWLGMEYSCRHRITKVPFLVKRRPKQVSANWDAISTLSDEQLLECRPKEAIEIRRTQNAESKKSCALVAGPGVFVRLIDI